MAHVKNNSGNDEWYTPQWIIEAVKHVLGRIDTDPASCAVSNKVVGAMRYYSKEEDGLLHPWLGNVFLNPPYSRGLIGKFIAKLDDEVGRGNITCAIVLTNNATETDWGQRLLGISSAVCFLRGRVRYLNAELKQDQTPLQGQMVTLVGGGDDAYRHFYNAFAGFGDLGKVCVVREKLT